MRQMLVKTVVLLVAGAATVAGCGSGGSAGGPEDDAPKIPRTASGSLEHLAKEAGCRPDIQTDAADLRQANCGTGKGRYVLATFTTDKGQAEWFDQANDYGGVYLVGPKWIAVGGADRLTELRGRLGGTLERPASSHH
ncbi:MULTISPECIES: hypothetical protein [unclassified Streptomyces]|uniref:hypothetical protein n=1 Tax=unclassified Streptomyces TaxID=2593676 RepID=UPI00278BF26C|nr:MULTISPECIES: hypothetical protein [unclassified Streptomyces]